MRRASHASVAHCARTDPSSRTGPIGLAFPQAKNQKTRRLIMRLVCTFVLFSALVWAQSFQGSLRGRVTDPKDSTVPLAKVSLVDQATSVSSSTVTNEQ